MHASELVGGIVALPSFVSDSGEPYPPAALVLVEPDSGTIVGTTLARPDEVVERAPAMFLEMTGAPLVGAPRMPSRVRVAAPELFAALRDRVGDVDVVLAPTPEAWMEAFNREPTGLPMLRRGAPPRGAPPPVSSSPRPSRRLAKARAKRKAARKARKASRRR